ncbi:MAG: hypothetical protein ACOC2L_05685, partial [Candidatus Sumerlaeota bacterium]
ETFEAFYRLSSARPAIGGLAGIALITTVFSGQVFGPGLILLGSILLTSNNVLDAHTIQLSAFLSSDRLFAIGAISLIGGLVMTAMNRSRT